jgi:MFS family permease
MWKSILEGINYVRQDAALSSLMSLAAMLNVCISGPMSVGLAYMAKTKFASPAAYGFAVSALAAGGLCGALLAGVWKIKRRGVFLLMASAVIGVSIGLLGFLDGVGPVAVLLFVMAVAAAATNIHVASWIQGRVDPAVRGRVVSVLMLCAFGLLPISLAGAGFLVAWSLTGMFLVAGGAMLLVTAAGASRASVRAIA